MESNALQRSRNVPQTEECESSADKIEWVEDKRAKDVE